MNKLLIALILIFFISCQKEYDLDLRGKWQVKYENRSGITYAVDTIFYNFDNNVLAIQAIVETSKIKVVYGTFTQMGDSIRLEFLDPDLISYLQTNPCFGWTQNDVSRTFKIEKLNSTTLHIRDSRRELILEKF